MTNKLKSEKSPYLLQHANNPVDWYPWCQEAFLKAKREDRPIFLSIGYSACHWCHVMARESFEDKETADFLNQTFVSIKVDREEQPDVDHFYMDVCHKLTGSGGWPLSVFMTPDGRPFFAGTYFPKRTYGNMPAFIAVLEEISRLWKVGRKRLLDAADAILREMESQLKPISQAGGPEAKGLAVSVFEHLKLAFDHEHGGFGNAPKFPTTGFLNLLLGLYERQKNRDALDMACFTLEKMRLGGIWDHVGGGFHRYSVDERWLVPHFEKMLYDQALLIHTYLKAHELSGNRLFLETARETARFCMDELMSKEKGFYSALDADSEGREGEYYVWSAKELEAVLGNADFELFKRLFLVEEEGNFENGKNVIALRKDLESLSKDTGKSLSELEEFVQKALGKLFSSRRRRIRPARDEKIITAWNGLMIGALVELSRVCNEKSLLDMAEKCLDLILKRLFLKEGLFRRLIDLEAKYRACLEDYACLLFGASKIYEEGKNDDVLYACRNLVREIRQRFLDESLNMLLYAPISAKDLPLRVTAPPDGALPSPVSVLFRALKTLSPFWDDENARLLLDVTKRQGLFEASRNPLGNCAFLACVLEENEA